MAFSDAPPVTRAPAGGKGLTLTLRGLLSHKIYGSGPAAAGTVLTADGKGAAGFTPASPTITYGTKTSDVTTTGSSFAAGADLLASALSFTADGTSDYVVEVASRAWLSSASGDIFADINLDTASGGILANYTSPGTGQAIPLRASGVIVAPTAGAHTVNVRVYSATGSPTLVVKGNIGGAGASVPILVWVRKA